MGKLLGKVERGAQSSPAPFKSQSFPNLLQLKEGRAMVPGWRSWSTLLAGAELHQNERRSGSLQQLRICRHLHFSFFLSPGARRD